MDRIFSTRLQRCSSLLSAACLPHACLSCSIEFQVNDKQGDPLSLPVAFPLQSVLQSFHGVEDFYIYCSFLSFQFSFYAEMSVIFKLVVIFT